MTPPDPHSVEALLGLAPLQVGQRVRVRLSGETPLDCRLPDEMDGCTGSLVGVDRWSSLPYDHCVRIDMSGSLLWLARCELERI